ncbi:sodium-coupled monocarboxylate transporter 2 [Dermacentor silvarum]|uniref:sodium-coupled monocarboxylate transporter 2 n=1 Tax=Dermacentor silvarum TaxID=543639 RepID=UPI0021013155|nr:sodium-coupled monocarboxylate transporter 2 [Dermacentor silvarum]
MRFDNKVGITACVIYFVLSQTLGAIGIYSAAIAISTMLSVPLIYTDIAIGLAGTTYTALGGLRSVVWADCIQAAVMIASPIVIIAKVFYDSHRVSQPLRPLSDFNVTTYMLRIAIGGGLMVFMFFVLVGFTAIAVIYWFRDCDPLLSGSISNYDQGRPTIFDRTTQPDQEIKQLRC